MARGKKSEPRAPELIGNTVTIPLQEVLRRVTAGEDHATLHRQRMTESDWKIVEKMTPEDRSSVENVIGQLRTGMANPKNAAFLEKKRREIFVKYE